MHRSNVDLPDPDGPITTSVLPASTSSETSLRTLQVAERLVDVRDADDGAVALIATCPPSPVAPIMRSTRVAFLLRRLRLPLAQSSIRDWMTMNSVVNSR